MTNGREKREINVVAMVTNSASNTNAAIVVVFATSFLEKDTVLPTSAHTFPGRYLFISDVPHKNAVSLREKECPLYARSFCQKIHRIKKYNKNRKILISNVMIFTCDR